MRVSIVKLSIISKAAVCAIISVRLGSRQFGYFTGTVDEVVVYKRAMTVYEVLNRYNEGGP